MLVGKITNKIVREAIAKTVFKNKSGNKTYLIKYEESYIVATSEIDGARVLPRDTTSLTNELQQLIRDVVSKKNR